MRQKKWILNIFIAAVICLAAVTLFFAFFDEPVSQPPAETTPAEEYVVDDAPQADPVTQPDDGTSADHPTADAPDTQIPDRIMPASQILLRQGFSAAAPIKYESLTIEGVVTDCDGTPVPDAWISEDGRPLGSTDEQGCFAIQLEVPDWQQGLALTVRHNDFARRNVLLDRDEWENERQLIVLERGGVVQAYATLDGAPAHDYCLRLMMYAENYRQDCRTDENGFCQFDEVPVGEGQITLFRQDSESGPAQIQDMFVEADKTTTVDFELVRGDSTVEGDVRIDGIPASGEVKARYADGTMMSTSHIENGHYKFESLVPSVADLAVSVQRDNDPHTYKTISRVNVVAGKIVRQDFTFDSSATGTIYGRVEGTLPGEEIGIGALMGDGETYSLTAFEHYAVEGQEIKEDGTYNLSHLFPGKYKLVVVGRQDAAPEIIFVSDALEMIAGANIEVNLALP